MPTHRCADSDFEESKYGSNGSIYGNITKVKYCAFYEVELRKSEVRLKVVGGDDGIVRGEDDGVV